MQAVRRLRLRFFRFFSFFGRVHGVFFDRFLAVPAIATRLYRYPLVGLFRLRFTAAVARFAADQPSSSLSGCAASGCFGVEARQGTLGPRGVGLSRLLPCSAHKNPLHGPKNRVAGKPGTAFGQARIIVPTNSGMHAILTGQIPLLTGGISVHWPQQIHIFHFVAYNRS